MMDITISGRPVGAGHPALIIAELSANHGHELSVAKETIRAMKESGADAVKLQTYNPDTITLCSDREYFRISSGTAWDGRTLYDLYREAYMPWDWQPELADYARSLGLICFSTPFDPTSAEFLRKLNMPAYKIASFEITDIPLIEQVAGFGKPVLISTGIATETEIREAVETCRRAGNDQVILLKCTSSYPAPVELANLSVIPDMENRFGVLTGLSDHTLGSETAVAAVALGARVIEKHFILDRKIGGPDASFSMEPADFASMTRSIRLAEKAVGRVTYELDESAIRNRVFSRSLFVTKPVRKGETLTADNVRSVRPGHGLPPKFLKQVIGRRAARDIEAGTPLAWDLIEKTDER